MPAAARRHGSLQSSSGSAAKDSCAGPQPQPCQHRRGALCLSFVLILKPPDLGAFQPSSCKQVSALSALHQCCANALPVDACLQVKHPMTMTEKILAAHSGNGQVRPGDNIWTNVDKLLTHDVCGPGTFGIFQREFGMDAEVGAEIGSQNHLSDSMGLLGCRYLHRCACQCCHCRAVRQPPGVCCRGCHAALHCALWQQTLGTHTLLAPRRCGTRSGSSSSRTTTSSHPTPAPTATWTSSGGCMTYSSVITVRESSQQAGSLPQGCVLLMVGSWL